MINYYMNALGYTRHFTLFKRDKKPKYNNSMDIWKNYLVASARNLTRNRQNTAISLIGLTVGFLSLICILQYTSYESSYDNFHNEKVYRLTHTFKNNASVSENAYTFLAVKDAIKEQVPEIKESTNYLLGNAVIKKDDKVFQEPNVLVTTPDFFKIFSFEILKGNPEDLIKPNALALSHSIAIKYFGTEDAIGERLQIDNLFGNNWAAEVVLVFEDFPQNSHFHADIFAPTERLIQAARENNFFGSIPFHEVPWRWLGFQTYVTLKNGASTESVRIKINEIIGQHRETTNKKLNQDHSIWLQPIESIHTTTGIQAEMKPPNDGDVLFLFSIIAFVILGIAWINYINIATARSITRGKEVGVRKVLGSTKNQLQAQFLLESLILNLTSLILAVFGAVLIAPYLEEIVEVNFFDTFFENTELLLLIFGVWLLGSFLSGWYPAFTLSGFPCLEVLKGKLKYSNGGVMLRRILVISQISFSIFLVSALLIVQSQMNFMLNHNLGVNIDRTLLLNQPITQGQTGNYESSINAFIEDIKKLSDVKTVSTTTIVPGVENQWRSSIENTSGDQQGVFVHRSQVDENYLDLFGLELVAGRGFSEEFTGDSKSVLVNETTLKTLGYTEPSEIINQTVKMAADDYKVIGVVKDFYQRGAHLPFEPITFNKDSTSAGFFIAIKVNTDNMRALLTKIEESYAEFFPGAPYNNRFMDDVFREQYQAEFRFRNLFTLFSTIALLIACLGIVGLSSYLVNQKTKEIGIRKVLGATGANIFFILNKEYLWVTIISFLISVPVLLILGPSWLDDFENRINMHPGYFIGPVISIAILILMTTAGYTMKALKINPARTLKEE